MTQTIVLIIGASISGLACAATLQKHGISYIIIEKEAQTVMPWRNHYKRLHLHTPKVSSHLPYKKFDSKIPRYPSRQQVIDYLDDYQKEYNIQPVFKTKAERVKRVNDNWITETNTSTFQSKYIIIATGAYGKPKVFYCKGIETFSGNILHSSKYKTGKDFRDQNILVIGFGNSACEIALDLYEHGAFPAMSVRSAVNIIPRDLLGIPILRIGLLLSKLPYRLADFIVSPVVRLLFGDITKFGLQRKHYGVFHQIKKDGTIPLIDIGTVSHIKQGHLTIFNEIERIENKTVRFTDGRQKEFDAIIAAIGYERNDTNMIDVETNRFDDAKQNVNQQKNFGKDGLYFCGFHISATGLIRGISLDAKRIVKDIVKKENHVIVSLQTPVTQ